MIINLRKILVLFTLMGVCLFTNAQYVRRGKIYTAPNNHCRYNGSIEEQFYYRDKKCVYVNVIASIYISFLGEYSLDSIKVFGNIKNGKEDGLFSFYLMDGQLMATAEMKKGKIKGKVNVYFDERSFEYEIRHRKIIRIKQCHYH